MAGSNYKNSVGHEFDDLNNLPKLVEVINTTTRTTFYAYDKDNWVTSITNGSVSETYTYDSVSRVDMKEAKNGSTTVLTDTFTYSNPSTTATAGQARKLQSVASGYSITYTYTYDDNGNILSVGTSDGKSTTYTYDSANQLIRENNQAAGKTWVWTYDDAGNILSRKEYAYTTGTLGSVQSTVNYAYDSTWGDLLKTWNGKTIQSDTIGNMTSDGTWSYTWEHGRELASMTGGGTTWSFTYDADGMRTARTNGSTTYSYVYNGGSLSSMTVGGNTLYFSYDAAGAPMSVTYNGTEYYYATNLQGDVVVILDDDGDAVVSYTYDAWGRPLTTTGDLSSTLGTHNPLRYRGYVYDHETQLYYLQSRYYCAELCRFISSDTFFSTGQGILGNNMFTYCLNNPINASDYLGTDAIYVVDTSEEEGLPVVGHAIVYIQDADGNWHMTDYAGVFPDKSTARIRIKSIDNEQIEKLLKGEMGKSIQYVYIQGDFTASVTAAKDYSGTDYNGYNLASNNCSHYAREILLKGEFENNLIRAAVSNNASPVPMDLLRKIADATLISSIWEGVVNGVQKVWRTLQSVF